MIPYRPNSTFWQRTAPHRAFLCIILLTTCCLCAALSGAEYGADWRPITKATNEQSGPWVYADFSAYCPCKLCCGDRAQGITADGSRVSRFPYGIACDLAVIPYGSIVFIPLGLGVLDRARNDDRLFICDDAGEAIAREGKQTGHLRFDLRVKDHWWAVQFGRNTLPILIHKKTN